MNQLGNLEKLGILVIVILVVVVGVVAITPKANVDTALFPDEPKIDAAVVEPLDPIADAPADRVTPAGDTPVVDPSLNVNAWPLPGEKPSELGDVPAGSVAVKGDKLNGSVIAPVPVEPQVAEYVVQKGDTGASIAKKLLGKATAWSEFVAVNPGLDAKRLKIGQKIKVPATAGAAKAITVPTPKDAPMGVVPPTPAPTPVVEAPAPAAEKMYTVQPGDTLTDIARRELGSSSKWHQIVDANPEMGGSEVIRAGMKLRIPAKSAVAAKVSTPKELPTLTVGGKTYKVQRGDTLSSIASRMLGSSSRWREIVAANEPVLHGSDKISVGMDLTIPSGTDAR